MCKLFWRSWSKHSKLRFVLKISSSLGVPLETGLCSSLLFPQTLFLDRPLQGDWRLHAMARAEHVHTHWISSWSIHFGEMPVFCASNLHLHTLIVYRLTCKWMSRGTCPLSEIPLQGTGLRNILCRLQDLEGATRATAVFIQQIKATIQCFVSSGLRIVFLLLLLKRSPLKDCAFSCHQVNGHPFPWASQKQWH